MARGTIDRKMLESTGQEKVSEWQASFSLKKYISGVPQTEKYISGVPQTERNGEE